MKNFETQQLLLRRQKRMYLIIQIQQSIKIKNSYPEPNIDHTRWVSDLFQIITLMIMFSTFFMKLK
jgi:hypothetical protein